MLKATGAEHRHALVFNTASIAGKSGQAWLSVYSATKAGVIGSTQAMNRELAKTSVTELRGAGDRVPAPGRAALSRKVVCDGTFQRPVQLNRD